jgi:NhaP-type Na+/H+ or K+/H+ antiporter
MDDEEGAPGMEKQLLKSLAMSAIGEVSLLLGLIFIFLGASAFISDLLRIKGSGEFMVGLVLVVAAFIFLTRSKLMPMIRLQKGGPPAQQPPTPPPEAGSYR